MREHLCVTCHNPILDWKPGQVFHKGDCSREHMLNMRLARYGENIIKIKPERLCEWCGKPLSENSPSATKYHDGNCKQMGYTETNARNQRSYRFRREMGYAKHA